MARNETSRTWYGWPPSSSAQRTRVSRASPLPPSGDRSKAVMMMVIAFSLAGAGKLSRQAHRRDALLRKHRHIGLCLLQHASVGRTLLQPLEIARHIAVGIAE